MDRRTRMGLRQFFSAGDAVLDNPIRGLGFFAARMTAADVFLRLLALLAWPIRLSSDYSFNQIPLFNGHLNVGETWLRWRES